MSNGYRDATFYAQVEPEWSQCRGRNGDPILRGAKVVTTTQKRPTRPRPGTVLVKLTIGVPDGAFLPLRPEAVVVIPEDMTVANAAIEVEAGDPS